MIVGIQKIDMQKIIESIGSIEKLPLDAIAGAINIPITLASGEELIFQIKGEKEVNIDLSHVRSVTRTPSRGITDPERLKVADTVHGYLKSLMNHGMTIKTIAEELGCSTNAVGLWWRRKGVPEQVNQDKLFGLKPPEVSSGHLNLSKKPLSPLGQEVTKFCADLSITKKEICEKCQIPINCMAPFLRGEWGDETTKQRVRDFMKEKKRNEVTA